MHLFRFHSVFLHNFNVSVAMNYISACHNLHTLFHRPTACVILLITYYTWGTLLQNWE